MQQKENCKTGNENDWKKVDAIIAVGCDSCLVTATIAGMYNMR